MSSTADSGRRIVREILSFGDSVEERTAVRIVAEQLSAVPKSVMFLPSPTPSQIVGQLAMVTQNLPHVCSHGACLDLEISREQAEHSAASALGKAGGSSTRALATSRGVRRAPDEDSAMLL
jgi:hypothetical protein